MIPETLQSKRFALIVLFTLMFIANEAFSLNMNMDNFRDVIFAGIGGYTLEQTLVPSVRSMGKKLDANKPPVAK